MKKIGLVGMIGHIGIGKTLLTSNEIVLSRNITDEEQEQVKVIEKIWDRISNLESFDDRKCRKGHSYEKSENKYGNEIRVKWICKNCQLELK